MKWPPIIENARLPMWMRLRDFVLTLLAWLVLLYLLRDMMTAGGYWVLDRFGIEHPVPPWPAGKILRDLAPFMGVVLLLVGWLAAFALVRWRRLIDTREALSQPDPLEPAVQADALGLSRTDGSALQDSRVMVVHLREDGTVSGVEPRGPDRPAG
ncbi:poly-beta-1,6-N-acetyl-D-glucosamine biosynthesis protein PgaD [Lysobacter panacisoli]|nr:poly-beta-1,6-N-acetyl-D-glucosamine biosynthesis protein PgaD [Lysobacter panacisoli]